MKIEKYQAEVQNLINKGNLLLQRMITDYLDVKMLKQVGLNEDFIKKNQCRTQSFQG